MDFYDFFKLFFEAVADDGAIDAWAKQHFGRPARVTVGGDNDTGLPTVDDMPYIFMGDPGTGAGRERRTIDYDFIAWLAIDMPGLVIRSEENLKQPNTIELITDFTTLYKDAIVGALTSDIILESLDITIDTLGVSPQAHALVETAFIQRLNIGQDPMDA